MRRIDYENEYKMQNFFVGGESKIDGGYVLTEENHHHLSHVLRMKENEKLYISCAGRTDLCAVEEITANETVLKIIEQSAIETELPVELTLFQGLPKSGKMDTIIQKCTELGVSKIVPVQMKRSVVRLDEKKAKAKRLRWQAIAEAAAKQSKRNVIPEIGELLSFFDAIKAAQSHDLLLVPYENERGMADTAAALQKLKTVQNAGIFIGPEGGFEKDEIELAKAAGGRIVSLGSRILRTETAAELSVGMCMLALEMQESEND